MNDYFLNEIDLDGFQVVKSQYFQKQAEPVLTLWATSIAFGQGAYQALNSCESIQLMINERRKCIIISVDTRAYPIRMERGCRALLHQRQNALNGL